MPLGVNVSMGKPLHARTVLVLAPHPDDEVLGCGGTLLHYTKSDADITIIYLTDGRYGIDAGDIQTRRTEAESIKEILPTVKQLFWDFPDCALYENILNIQLALKQVITELQPDLILSPWLFDRHPDHEATSLILTEALKEITEEVCISLYEIMLPLIANHTVNISAYADEKQMLIDKYESQVTRYNLKAINTRLNHYRAELFRRSNVKLAESFFVIEKSQFIELVDKLFCKN